ncbi:MAG TPA: DEAD/DEAH box helicase [Thermoanaerobaculia bacterium]
MSETAREYFVAKLNEQIDVCSAVLARQGIDVLPKLVTLQWDPDSRRFFSRLPDLGAGFCLVDVHLPGRLGDEVRSTCTCYLARVSQGCCRHTWALMKRVALMLLHQPEDPLVRQALEVDDRPIWTRTLDVLDALLEVKDALHPAEAAPRRRVTWRVAFLEGGSVAVGAWEQKVSKRSGKWTAGRRMSWDDLRLDPELLTREADRRALAAVEREPYSYFGSCWTVDTIAVLRALAGHPLVFLQDEPKKNVRIEEVELGLSLSLGEDGLFLDGSLDGLALRSFPPRFLLKAGRGLAAYVEDPGRILVAAADPRIVELVLHARGADRAVPEEGREEVLRRLSGLEGVMPVTVAPELVDGTRKADRRLFLRLTPGEPGEGMSAQLLVRPSPQGSYFRPGEGPARLLSHEDGSHEDGSHEAGRRILVERSPEAEKAAARDRVDLLGLGKHEEERPWQWRIASDDDALDVVLAAQDEAGRGLVVEWPEGGRRRVSSSATPAALRVRLRGQRDWFGVEGTVEGDGWRLPLLAVLRALREGRRYLPVGDGTWALITGELRDRLAALDDVVHVHGKRLEVGVTAVPVLRDLAGDGGPDAAVVDADRRFAQTLRRLAEAEALDPEPPADLTAELRGYQVEGYRWLRRLAAWGVGGCLADDMGLGKTVQTLAVLIDRREAGPALVVAPTSVGFNWIREVERFAPSLAAKLYRETDRDTVLGELGAGDVVVASYGLVLRDAAKLARVAWGTLVLDEAQAIKNSRAKTARAVRSLEALWRLALTGTPVENHLGELWSLFRAVSPGLFGTWERFSLLFATPIEKHQDLGRREALSRLLRPFVLRRAKSQVLAELPERTEVQLLVELGAAERRLYEDARLKALLELSQPRPAAPDGGGEDGKRRFQVLAALTRLRQLACHPALVDPDWTGGSAKLDLLLETVEELLDEGHRALVFSQFVRHLGLARRAFDQRGIRYQYLDGQTPAGQRAERIDAFQNGDGDLFLISLKAGGTGLNLTAADYVIHMDPWWNPAVEDQATDRAHRIGQNRPVTVYRLVSRATIEEEILSLHEGKRDLVAGVLAGTDQAGKLSTADLVGLIRSGGEA